MSKRDIGQEILDGIREIKAFKADQVSLRTHTLKEPASPQVIRAKLKLSQSDFAGLMVSACGLYKIGSKADGNPAVPLRPYCVSQNKNLRCF
jgi:hypothetical protein